MTNRFVVDTNIIVSALLMPNSVPAVALRLARRIGIILQSQATIDELNRVLHRKKFDKYIAEANRLEFLTKFTQKAEFVEVHHTVTICRDPNDNKFLELALSGSATLIVSGDNDLLVLSPFHEIVVMPPVRFIEHYDKSI